MNPPSLDRDETRRLAALRRAVARAGGLRIETLRGPRRTARVAWWRELGCWLARRHSRATWARIGDLFGRSPGGACHAAGRCRRRLEKDPDARLMLAGFCARYSGWQP